MSANCRPALGYMSTLGVRALSPALARLRLSHLPFQPTCLSQVHVLNLLLLRIVQAPPHQILVCLPPKAFLPFRGHCFGDGATTVVKPGAGFPSPHLRFPLLSDGPVTESSGNWILVDVPFWVLLYTYIQMITFNSLQRALSTLLYLPWPLPLCGPTQEPSHQFELNLCFTLLSPQAGCPVAHLPNFSNECLVPAAFIPLLLAPLFHFAPCILSSHLSL